MSAFDRISARVPPETRRQVSKKLDILERIQAVNRGVSLKFVVESNIMYKNAPLPEDCPPIEAKQLVNSLRLYRILPTEMLNSDSFLTYRQLHPENKRYRNLCIAFAVSMFTSEEFAIAANQAAISRNKVLGTHLAELEIHPEHGKYELNPTNGHCSFWFYESCIFERISCSKIIQIDENT